MHAIAGRLSIPVTQSARKRLLFSSLFILVTLGFGVCRASAQSPNGASGVSRTAKAITFRRGTSDVKVSLRGTTLMPQGLGEARVDNKGNRVEIEAGFAGLEAASKFGFEYLTYVLWAVSP